MSDFDLVLEDPSSNNQYSLTTAPTQNNQYSLTTATTQNNQYSSTTANSETNASWLANAVGHPVGETGDQGSEASLELVTDIIDLLKDFTGG